MTILQIRQDHSEKIKARKSLKEMLYPNIHCLRKGNDKSMKQLSQPNPYSRQTCKDQWLPELLFIIRGQNCELFKAFESSPIASITPIYVRLSEIFYLHLGLYLLRSADFSQLLPLLKLGQLGLWPFEQGSAWAAISDRG